ncbi:hypothetical protein HBI39_221050 [Parastagonospora nodorum]|nr:hypothetical protein HBI39_221050 [Parastagonospora nodorum]
MDSSSLSEGERIAYEEDDGRFDVTIEDDDLQEIVHSKKLHLAVNPKYGQGWTREHGFREFVQNWRDGIMKKNSMSHATFRANLEVKKEPGLIEICSYRSQGHANDKKLLGFIRFKYDKATLAGVLTISNFDARLQLWHFMFGGTTKDKDTTQTGQHGEGMKMAILIFRKHPNNHTMRIEASGFSWAFNFDGQRQLVCNLTRIGKERIRKEKLAVHGQPRTTDARCWSDVSIVIGEPRLQVDGTGMQVRSNKKILLSDFEQWLEICLDFKNPKTVPTKTGELILDGDCANKLYLQGIHLSSSSNAPKSYRFGYNFFQGYTDRERRVIGHDGKKWSEPSLVNAIWAEVLDTKKEEYIDIYTNMMLESTDKVADVTLAVNGYWLPREVICKVWKQMRSMNVGEDGRPAFYHAPDLRSNDINVVTNNLDMHPHRIPEDVWKMLRSYKLCRTPQEELEDRFKNSEPVSLPDTPFAQNLHWMLRCCLVSRSDTEAMTIEYVRGQGLGIDAAVFGTQIKVSDRFLTYTDAHSMETCGDPEPNDTVPFSCDHLVLELWSNLLALLPSTTASLFDTKAEHRTKSLMAKRLSQMPRMITCAQTVRRGELRVTWESNESARNSDRPVVVVVHKVGCTHGNVPAIKIDDAAEHFGCHCPFQLSKIGSRTIVFKDLVVEEYYATVSCTIQNSFSSEPSEVVLPRSILSEDSESEEEMGSPEFNTTPPAPIRQHTSSVGVQLSSTPFRSGRSQEMFDSSSQASPTLSVTASSRPESYTIGTRVDHRELKWDSGFPGSHEFYYAQGRIDNVYIARPRDTGINENGKRPQQGLAEDTSAKKARHIFGKTGWSVSLPGTAASGLLAGRERPGA